MRRRSATLLALVLCLAGAAAALMARAPAALTIVSAGPTGEVAQLQDANEIRVIFSEPMIALGRAPADGPPPWIQLSPATAGTWRWSGTTILIFSPATANPYATTYTVTISGAAASAAGQTLGTPYSFSFTTPTVRLLSARWARQGARFDTRAALALTFNQPVRPADVAAHVTARFAAHDVRTPDLTPAERARMASIDPAGPQRYDEKLAAARRTAARTDAVPLRVATTWDRRRFPDAPTQVVLETVTPPPPGAWLTLNVARTMPSPAGSARPTAVQSSVVELDPVFFVQGLSCKDACTPSRYNSLEFSVAVETQRFAQALVVTDITNASNERRVARAATQPSRDRDTSEYLSLDDAGFDRQPPATRFALSLDPALEAADGQVLGFPWVGIVRNWHETAFTSFGDGHGVWESAGGRLLPFYARNYRAVTERLAPLTLQNLMPRLLELQKADFTLMPPGAGTRRRLNIRPDEIQSHGLDLGAALGSRTSGIFWAAAEPSDPIPESRAVPRDRSTIVQVTNLGITVKDSPQSTLVFVTRLDTGAPVPAARVSIVNTNNQAAWTGTTGPDGVAMAPALPLRSPEDWYEFSFIVTAEKDGDVAYVGSDWHEGILPWEFGASYELWEATDILRGSVFADRGVYRPGESVEVKAIVRRDTPQGVRMLPAGSTLDVRVFDSRDREVDRRSVIVSRWSSAEWSWTVPAEATLGGYRVQALLPGTERPEGNDVTPRVRQADWLKRVQGTFTVAAYRKPDFRVDTTLGATPPVAGSPVLATLEARYLFGGTMGGRPLRWSMARTPTTGVPDAVAAKFPLDKFNFGYLPENEDQADERIAGEMTSLDGSGKFTVSQPTQAGGDLPYVYRFEGDVEDVSRQHIASRSSVTVYPAPWHIGVRRPPYFVDASAGASVDVVAVAHDGAVVPGVNVSLSLVRSQWNSVRRAEGSGFYTWETERIDVPSGTWSVTTAGAPIAHALTFTEGGFYTLRAEATDGTRRTRTDTSFYVLGRGYTAWQRYDHNRITLEPEKRTWRPGERARIMIQSPWESATALLTVEREGIRSYERFQLTSTQQTVEVPISEADIPNVYVSVLLIRGRTSQDPGADGDDPGRPAFRLGYTELRVEDASKRLAVAITADRAEYRPANNARVSVAVTDRGGAPVRGEVTLWAVDYGVLSLTGYQAPDVLRAVYQDKALQVMNTDNRQRVISRRVLTPKGGDEGGGGGNEGGARVDFRPLAFWLGSVETDASGRATRQVTLPDALTTYRIMAVAGDASSRFGAGAAEIRVSQPVVLLPAFPRFLTPNDRASFGAVLTSTMTQGGEATVSVRSLDPHIVRFEGQTAARVRLAAGGSEAVRFGAVAVSPGTARIRVSARLNGQSDAFESTLAVVAPARTEVVAAFGDTDTRAAERLAIPTGIVPSLGGLEVNLSSTALVGLGEGARYLADYPFYCAEQKASAALALTLAADLGSAFSMGRIAPADYQKRAGALLAELPKYQCADGGFGYWPGGCLHGDVYLTSYILHVMHVARDLGHAQDAEVVTHALNFLEEAIQRPAPRQVQWIPAWSASNAFGVKVLAEYGRNQDSNITRLLQAADRLPIFALSYVADAMAITNRRDARYPDVIRRITNAMRVEGERAFVQEIDEDGLAWIWNSNVRATALVLEGLARRGDDPTFVQRSVRWLLAARRNGRWSNTQENATALEALVKYYKAFEAEPPNMSATVALGSRAVGTARFVGRSTATQSVRLAMPDLLKQVAEGTERELAMARTGTGRLYYTARLAYVPAVPPTPADQGIRVERRYERFVEKGAAPAATEFNAGDLIRVTLAVTLPKERRYLAVNDALPAGVETVDGFFRTTASDLAAESSRQSSDASWEDRWRRGGFDHVEKYDDRVVLFATRLSEGRHEFSYVVRATTSGTFAAPGTWAEEMYAPEVFGRAPAATIVIK